VVLTVKAVKGQLWEQAWIKRLSSWVVLMTDKNSEISDAFEGLDQDKRETLTRLAGGGAFVAPVVAAFAMQGISISPAHAAPGSSSNATKF
jgi:hypothetical protein